MHNIMKTLLVIFLLTISSVANAASTFVVSLPLGYHVNVMGCEPIEGVNWTPCVENPNFYPIIDLRGVVALRMRVQGTHYNPNYPDPYHPSVPSYIGLQISTDGGQTFNCITNGSECLRVAIPIETVESVILISPSGIMELPRQFRADNAILRLAISGDDRVDVVLAQVQFYKLF